MRTTLDVELRPLLRAIRTRIGNLDPVLREQRDGVEVYTNEGVPFLQLELRRDHMHLDLWLTDEQLEEARASGIARPHPFLGERAVRVRFERAEDLTRVAHWLETSHQTAPERAGSEPSSTHEGNGAAPAARRRRKSSTAGKPSNRKTASR